MKFKQFREKLNESPNISTERMMPNILMLRRIGVRMFPDGKKVALYNNQRYNLLFSVPFGGTTEGDKPQLDPVPQSGAHHP